MFSRESTVEAGQRESEMAMELKPQFQNLGVLWAKWGYEMGSNCEAQLGSS